MKKYHSYQKPLNKNRLDFIKNRLDRIRHNQSKIYTRFNENYNNQEIEEIVTDEQMDELNNEVREVSAISNALKRIDNRMSKRLIY